jgi:uncharacterized protein YidB (DUF937 family)
MGLLDQLAGMLTSGALGGASGGASNVGGLSPAMIQQVLGMLGGAGAAGGAGGAGAGLGGLIAAFEQGGLGHIVQSWIANGANLPVSAAQLQQVLGNGQLAQIAQALGVDHNTAAGGLAQVLPEIVNHLTPNGTVPAAGDMQASLQSLAKQLFPS